MEKSRLTLKFGARVRQLRKRKGWSIQKLSERAGLNNNFLQKIETGVQSVSLPYVEKIASGLEIAVQELFAFDEPVAETKKRLRQLVDKIGEQDIARLARIIEAALH